MAIAFPLRPSPSPSCSTRDLQHVSASDKDGARETGSETRDAVPCEFWRGSRKLFTLAAFRGKLGEFSTWPIVLHYSDDKVHSLRGKKKKNRKEIYIFGCKTFAELTDSVKMSYATLYSLIRSDKNFRSFSASELQNMINSKKVRLCESLIEQH